MKIAFSTICFDIICFGALLAIAVLVCFSIICFVTNHHEILIDANSLDDTSIIKLWSGDEGNRVWTEDIKNVDIDGKTYCRVILVTRERENDRVEKFLSEILDPLGIKYYIKKGCKGK